MKTPENTQIELAPGAGAGLGRLVFDNLLAEKAVAKEIADTMRAGLNASTKRWDKALGEWVAEPDWRTRMQAAFGILAQAEGEPIKRIVHQHLGERGAATLDVSEALRESPALAAAMERELEKARWKKSGQQDHKRRKAEPIEVVEVD